MQDNSLPISPREFIEIWVASFSGRLVSKQVIREILTCYTATPEGREKLLKSCQTPVRLALDTAMRATFPECLTNWDNLLKIIPVEERATDAYRQLRSLVGDLKGTYDAKRAK